jgi:hypothetical protein
MKSVLMSSPVSLQITKSTARKPRIASLLPLLLDERWCGISLWIVS